MTYERFNPTFHVKDSSEIKLLEDMLGVLDKDTKFYFEINPKSSKPDVNVYLVGGFVSSVRLEFVQDIARIGYTAGGPENPKLVFSEIGLSKASITVRHEDNDITYNLEYKFHVED